MFVVTVESAHSAETLGMSDPVSAKSFHTLEQAWDYFDALTEPPELYKVFCDTHHEPDPIRQKSRVTRYLLEDDADVDPIIRALTYSFDDARDYADRRRV